MTIHLPLSNKHQAPKRSRQWRCMIACTCLLLLISTGLQARESLSPVSNAGDNVKTVQVQSFKQLAIHVSHQVGASVPPMQNSTVSARIPAKIKQFHADTGFEVTKDQLLVSLDCREFELKRKQAEAALRAEKALLKNARSQFEQAKKLSKQGNLSREIYNQREAEESRLKATVESRRLALELAALNVERCQINAPFDGYITRRDASVGELTSVGTPLLQILSKKNNLVEVQIHSHQLDSFINGRNHRYLFQRRSYPLALEHIVPVLDPNSHNHIARLRFTGEPALTGSIGKLLWEDARLSIPAAYVVQRNGKLGVLVAEDNIARFVPVENAIEGLPVNLKLDDDTPIITEGRYNIEDGDHLNIRTAGKADIGQTEPE